MLYLGSNGVATAPHPYSGTPRSSLWGHLGAQTEKHKEHHRSSVGKVWACLTAHLKYITLYFSARVVQGHTYAAVPCWTRATGWLLQLGRACSDTTLARAHKSLSVINLNQDFIMQMQLSSCPAHYKMPLTSLLLPLFSVENFRLQVQPCYQQLEVTCGRQLNFSNALLSLLQRGCFCKADREKNAERGRQTNQPNDMNSVQAGTDPQDGVNHSASWQQGIELCNSQTSEQGSTPFRQLCLTSLPHQQEVESPTPFLTRRLICTFCHR